MLLLVLLLLAAEIALGVVTLEEGAAAVENAVRLQPLWPMTRALARPIRKRPRL